MLSDASLFSVFPVSPSVQRRPSASSEPAGPGPQTRVSGSDELADLQEAVKARQATSFPRGRDVQTWRALRTMSKYKHFQYMAMTKPLAYYFILPLLYEEVWDA